MPQKPFPTSNTETGDMSIAVGFGGTKISAARLIGIQLIAIGGGVGLAEGYIELVKQYLQEEPELFRPCVMTAGLGADSALFGVVT